MADGASQEKTHAVKSRVKGVQGLFRTQLFKTSQRRSKPLGKKTAPTYNGKFCNIFLLVPKIENTKILNVSYACTIFTINDLE